MGNPICKQGNFSAVNTVSTDAQNSQNIHPSSFKDDIQSEIPEQKQSSGSLPRSQKENNTKVCQKCSKQIEFTVIQLKCQKSCCYHPVCMEEHIKKLVDQNKQIIKCQCGTKINTSFLRQSSIPGKMNFLSKIFNRQLDDLLQSSQVLRKDIETQNYVKENRQTKEQLDYILIDQDTLLYEETIQ